MAYPNKKLKKIYDRTLGRCHLCKKKRALKNYAQFRKRGDWEVEHSKPRSKGGSDHMNNLYAACISSNRSKGNGPSVSARKKNGYKCAPYSKSKKVDNAVTLAGVLSLIAVFLVPPHVRIPGILAAALIGGKLGYDHEPN